MIVRNVFIVFLFFNLLSCNEIEKNYNEDNNVNLDRFEKYILKYNSERLRLKIPKLSEDWLNNIVNTGDSNSVKFTVSKEQKGYTIKGYIGKTIVINSFEKIVSETDWYSNGEYDVCSENDYGDNDKYMKVLKIIYYYDSVKVSMKDQWDVDYRCCPECDKEFKSYATKNTLKKAEEILKSWGVSRLNKK